MSVSRPPIPSIPVATETPPPRWAAQVPRLIGEFGGHFYSIQEALNISFHELRAEMIRQGLTVPRSKLPRHLSEQRYQELVARTFTGEGKKELGEEFEVSQFLLDKLGLWEPGLQHRWDEARRQRTIQRNRDALEVYLSANPGISRYLLFQELPGPYEFISRSDPEWLDARLARFSKSAETRPRRSYVDRAQADRIAASAVAAWAAAELSSAQRPRRLTASRFLVNHRLLARYHYDRTRFPLTAEALASHCEDGISYRKRRLSWAARACAKEGVPLSKEHLRLTSKMELRYVIEGWAHAAAEYERALKRPSR
ncbi:TnsD family Tn7-like transposition protein [Nevskia ramosa]|uniref:TnsD family Tn7-like transposition protein n=1 Tax=Nevskia ramosa TaxID=64002 RepID=UPI00235429B0|nr:hypothetical protein [Nevskia ramosa]